MAWQWEFIEQECTGCGICADLCPEKAIAMTREMGYPRPVPGKCAGCLLCVEQCPFGAVEVKELSPASVS